MESQTNPSGSSFPTPETTPTRIQYEDPFSSPRIQAIFAQGIVVQESRFVESATETPPELFANSILADHQRTVDGFNAPTVQRDFITKAVTEKRCTTRCTYTFSKDQYIPLVTQIQQHLAKGHKEVSFLKRKFNLPSIRTEYLDEVASGLEVYLQVLLDELSLSMEIGSRSLNRSATQAKLKALADQASQQLTTQVRRQQVYSLLLQASAIELVVVEERQNAASFIITSTLGITDSRQGGSFLRVATSPSSPTTRAGSMVHPSACSVALATRFNLKLRQMHQLTAYIFSKDVLLRTEAKIELLSSVNPDIRNDIALNPGKVLLASFSEHFLSRDEILHVVFCSPAAQRTDSSRRCPHCGTFVTITGSKALHPPCPVVSWLVTHCQFEHSNDTLVGPSYIYLRHEVADYAKKILALESNKRLTPYIARSEHDFKVMALNTRGDPQSIAHMGSKPVRLSDQPSAYTLRPKR